MFSEEGNTRHSRTRTTCSVRTTECKCLFTRKLHGAPLTCKSARTRSSKSSKTMKSIELRRQCIHFYGNRANCLCWWGLGDTLSWYCLVQTELDKYTTVRYQLATVSWREILVCLEADGVFSSQWAEIGQIHFFQSDTSGWDHLPQLVIFNWVQLLVRLCPHCRTTPPWN